MLAIVAVIKVNKQVSKVDPSCLPLLFSGWKIQLNIGWKKPKGICMPQAFNGASDV
jgi:hypothetical protein